MGIYSRDMEFADVVGGEHVSVLGLISSMLLNRAMLLRQHPMIYVVTCSWKFDRGEA